MSEFWTVIYLVACPIGWYLLAGLQYGLNGGQLGRQPYLFPLECFVEEIKCYWFGGQKHRIEFIKEQCGGEGVFCGSRRSYTHQEIRENNLYEEVFWAMMGGRVSFWGGQFLTFFFGPALIVILLVAIVVGIIFGILFWPVKKLRDLLVR